MRRKSKRFDPSTWYERLVPALLIFLILGLVSTLFLVVLSMLGFTPGW